MQKVYAISRYVVTVRTLPSSYLQPVLRCTCQTHGVEAPPLFLAATNISVSFCVSDLTALCATKLESNLSGGGAIRPVRPDRHLSDTRKSHRECYKHCSALAAILRLV